VHTREHLESVLAERYALGPVLARDVFTVRYGACDREDGRAVALAVVAAIPDELDVDLTRFLSLLQPNTGLTHPNVRRVEAWRESRGVVYGVMAHLEGESLGELLRREGSLDVDRAVQIATDLAAGLEYLHGRAIVQSYVDPHHVFLHADRALLDDTRVLLAVLGASGSEDCVVFTGPVYMAPEEARGDEPPDERRDQYRLACVLYEMLTGETAYDGWLRSGPTRGSRGSPRPPSPRMVRPSIPERIDRAVVRALAIEPKGRFPSCEAFARALAGR
jgi:serine/threonine-protein kinase